MLLEKVRLSIMNSARTASGSHASVFSLAILSGAAGLTIAEYVPSVVSEGAGFIVGFVLGFIVFSFIAYFAYSRPESVIGGELARQISELIKKGEASGSKRIAR